MNPVPDIYRILPEVILALTGVAVMLLDASLPPAGYSNFGSRVSFRIRISIFGFFSCPTVFIPPSILYGAASRG